ncbi:hypothetical protein AB0I60_05180 [Actinosynnema sp. NPDC050436]|uniref:hypothetical protein n=1 Tax=Actinosynnema sp. NPDC050436 TaxID=3155659 RepID=UPI0033C23A64
MTAPTPHPEASDLRALLHGRGFVASPSGRVHRHAATGARVVIDRADPIDLTVHAYCGAWRARLTGAPFPVIAATVDAALVRKDRSQ